MADSFDQFEALLREYIEPSVTNLEMEDDDVSWMMLDTFEAKDVAGRRADGAAGYECSWKVKVQEAGLVTGGTFAGNTQDMMGYGSDLSMGQAADALYPDATTAPSRAYLTIKMFLSRIKGILACNKQQLLADLATEPIEEVAGGFVMDGISQVRKMMGCHFWGDGTASIAQFNEAGTIYQVGTSVTGLTVKEGTPRRFKKGQRYIIATDAEPRVSKGVVRCVDIEMDGRTVTFQSEQGQGNISAVAGDHIMYHGTYDFAQSTHAAASRAANGILALLKETGNFPGTSYDVSKYSELRSYVDGSATPDTNPTPEVLALRMDKIADGGWEMPDVLIAEQSLWTLYAQMEREAGATYQITNGGTFVANGGVDGPQFTHGGKTFSRLSSAICRENTIHGLTPSTFKRFMPLGNKNIKWFYDSGGISGAQSIFGPVFVGGQVSELIQAPFDTYWQLGNTNPRRNFILKGLNNQRNVTS